MALKTYYDEDADLGRLDGETVAAIGYGSQRHAHAQNLHDNTAEYGGLTRGPRVVDASVKERMKQA